jgi:hypothetical protein
MANIKLNFFGKDGNPLNFDYIGPTGPTALDSKFTYITTTSGLNGNGDALLNYGTSTFTWQFYQRDLNNFNLIDWFNEVDEFIKKGANVYLNGEVAGQQSFSARIDTVIQGLSGNFTVIGQSDNYKGQNIISPNNQIYFTTTYENRPGGYFKGNIYFDLVSAGLYENEQIFIVQEFETSGGYTYGLPHTGATGATGSPKWRTRWYNDNYGETDVTDIIFTYVIENQLEGGDGEPLIVNYPNMVLPVDISSSDYYQDGYIYTNLVNSEALAINVALNASDEAENIYERKLIVEDITTGTPEKIIEIDFYGQIIGEDERFKVLLENLGRAFYKSDSVILRDHDPDEPSPNFLEINEKRKELLVTGEEIFPYIGSYKGLINALKFFGYQDLRIKEYWLNLNYKNLKLESPVQQNQSFLNEIKTQQSKGYSLSYQIGDILDNENSGKYRLTQTYGPDGNGNYVLNVTSEDSLVPSRTYKKTALFGLYYDLNRITDDTDEFGYPVVVDAFKFTQEEVLIKIFALKERLKRDYLPLNARIIDITGEGVYFMIYNTKSWTDIMGRSDIDSGFYFDFAPNPDFGFLEDLRNFSTRPLGIGIQTPSSYSNSYQTNVSFIGGTGSAISFSGDFPGGMTGSNPTIFVNSGSTYQFNVLDSGNFGYDFYLTTDPLLTQIDPLGVMNNGATGGNSLTWYVNPEQTSPIYYYSSNNTTLLRGIITVLPSTLSDLGNIIDPLSNQQIYTFDQNNSMLTAIENFYDLKQNGKIIELGDDDFDPNAYIDPVTGSTYQLPLGMPVILELVLDVWEWNELNINWNALIIPTYKVGDVVQVRQLDNFFYGVFGTVTSASYSTGEYTVLLDPPYNIPQNFAEADLLSSIQSYNLLTWENVDFSNAMEIEWIVNKSPTQNGSPYNFVFKGPIASFYKLAHFLPYTGEYKVICNIYDAFNAKTTVIKDRSIRVEPKTIDIDSWTRYREVEKYLWDNVDRGWDSYNSIWEYPAEGESIEVVEKSIPSEILKFATYGNKSEEGQSLYVKTIASPIGATGEISFSQNITTISEIYSLEIFPGQYGYSNISTSSPHGLVNGDEVTITGSVPQLNGRWVIGVTASSTTFKIPVVLDPLWNGINLETSPVNRYVTDNLIYPNQKFTGAGSITIFAGGRQIGTAETGDTLYNTANAITSAVNSLQTYPDYFASCLNPTEDPVKILISAPNNLGSDQNGVTLNVDVSGSLNLISFDPLLTGGISPSETYVFWSENDPVQPNENLKYWGTKRLNWEVFNDNTWENAYAHSWFDFEFNNDWLGGYELHTILPGDYVKISTASSTYPFPIGVTFTDEPGGLTLQDVADQLNSSNEPHITNFYYRPMPSDVGSLNSIASPINLDITNNFLVNSNFQPPPSLNGGSQLLIAQFGYTGGTPITTTTSTTTTSTTTTSTTTTSTSTTTTTSTSTTTTTTIAPTTTSTTTSTTTVDPCLLSGTASMVYPTTSTTTSTTSTTTIAPTTTSTTTTTTSQPLVLGYISSTSHPSDGCSLTTNQEVYIQGNYTRIFNDPAGNFPFIGDGNYYKIIKAIDSFPIGATVDSIGFVGGPISFCQF